MNKNTKIVIALLGVAGLFVAYKKGIFGGAGASYGGSTTSGNSGNSGNTLIKSDPIK
jgi:hypothetical protein